MRPVRTGEIHGRGPDPWGHYRRSGAFTPYTAIVNVTGQPAVSLPLYQGEDGLPHGRPAIGPPAREELPAGALAAAELASRRCRRRGRARVCASTAAIAPRGDPERARRRRSRGGDERDLEQLGLVPGGERRRAADQLHGLQHAAGQPHRDAHDRAAPAERARARARRSRGGSASRVRPARSAPPARCRRRPARQRGHHAVGHVLGPDRLKRARRRRRGSASPAATTCAAAASGTGRRGRR